MILYEGSVNTSKEDKEKIPTPEGDNPVKAPAGEHKSSHVDSNTALNRGNGEYLTLVRDRIRMHGPRNRESMSLTSRSGDNRHLATSKSDKRAEKESPKTLM